MRFPLKRWNRFAHHLTAALALLIFSACGLPLANHSLVGESGPQGDGPLSAEKRYAGEVLAYMLEVVLGQAGDLKRRNDWRHHGLGQPLDLDWILATMDHPERPKGDLLVMDASLIGLSEVLYDYNPRLNLFKGRYAFHSPYPSAELIALRLLLLGKLDRGETLTLSAIVQNEAALVAQGGALPAGRLAEMGLTADEATLLQDVFRSEPDFRRYYKSPPLVSAMAAMGLLTPERFVERLAGAYDFAAWRKSAASAAAPDATGAAKVRVAVLPSLIPGYRADNQGRLSPPEEVVHSLVKLKAALEQAVAAKEGSAVSREQLEIQLYLERPFVLHPLNSARQLVRLCPQADLAVIVLGRNVYRAMAFKPTGAASSPPHWYLDILDLKYGQASAEIDAIATAAAEQL
jgi:hypothetical protein